MSPEAGSLVAVVGPSGAGKDTVLAAVAERLAVRPDIIFVRRVITRAEGPGEDNVALSMEAFEQARSAGAFCLHWQAHGLSYALPASALAHAQAGGIAIANLSRRVLRPAADTFPGLGIIEITAPTDVLRSRLLARGRETAADIDARLDRFVPLDIPARAGFHVTIDNSGPLPASVARFIEAIERLRLSQSHMLPA